MRPAYIRFGDVPLKTRFKWEGCEYVKVQRSIAENLVTSELRIMTWEIIEAPISLALLEARSGE